MVAEVQHGKRNNGAKLDRDAGGGSAVASATKKKGAAAKTQPAKPATNLDVDGRGRRITIGCNVMADGPVFGRVEQMVEGVVVWRPFAGQNLDDSQPVLSDHHDALLVVSIETQRRIDEKSQVVEGSRRMPKTTLDTITEEQSQLWDQCGVLHRLVDQNSRPQDEDVARAFFVTDSRDNDLPDFDDLHDAKDAFFQLPADDRRRLANGWDVVEDAPPAAEVAEYIHQDGPVRQVVEWSYARSGLVFAQHAWRSAARPAA